MSKKYTSTRLADYENWLKDGAPNPLNRISDCTLLLEKPDLIEGAEPFSLELGMTEPSEQAFCQWYGAHAFKGWGEWVELGSFLGSLTVPGVRGLRVNPSKTAAAHKIRVYDLFRWNSMMVEFADYYEIKDAPTEGTWYIQYYKDYNAHVLDRVEVTQADLTRRDYSGEPIEFLVIDVMKYPALVTNILREFFPSLRAGSLVFHQDYLHFYEGWITLSMYQMQDCFKFRSALPEGDTVIFEATQSPNPEKLEFLANNEELTVELINDAFDWSRSVIPEAHHHQVDATQCMMYYHAGHHDECRALYQQLATRHSYPSSLADLKAYLENNKLFSLQEN
mgnify:CR=1 FL=1|jgi:hypothetical protein|tara:strand:+ start:113467 stop:114474 length:1008 start_codon:yes stop_codon:yes gene_type:complete